MLSTLPEEDGVGATVEVNKSLAKKTGKAVDPGGTVNGGVGIGEAWLVVVVAVAAAPVSVLLLLLANDKKE